MGAVLILTPVIISTWPALATAVASAAASLGYARLEGREAPSTERSIALEIPRSEVVTDQLGRDEKLSFVREGVQVTFQRDARGRAGLSVRGSGLSEEELHAIGEAMSQRVVRDYVVARVKAEVGARHYNIVEETEDESTGIRLTVRHWEH